MWSATAPDAVSANRTDKPHLHMVTGSTLIKTKLTYLAQFPHIIPCILINTLYKQCTQFSRLDDFNCISRRSINSTGVHKTTAALKQHPSQTVWDKWGLIVCNMQLIKSYWQVIGVFPSAFRTPMSF